MNEYFQVGSVPAPSSPGASSVIRQEFANIAAGFDKLPVLIGHGGELVFVDVTGSRLETNGTLITDFVTLTGAQALINKTIAWGNNTFTGFGDAATKVAGTGAGEVLLLAEADKLPALDGSLLTNLNQANLSTVSIAKGGTGATDLTGAQANLGINLKADANNAVLTGAPTAPTPLTGDSSARIATTYFVTDTMQAIGAFGPSSANPLMNGTVSPGVAILGSRSDHVHPSDASRVAKTGDTMTGRLGVNLARPDVAFSSAQFEVHAPTGSTNDFATISYRCGDQAAAYQHGYDGNNSRLGYWTWDGTSFLGGMNLSGQFMQAGVQLIADNALTRKDYVDTYAITPLALKAPLASPTFTGDPKAPTPLTTDNDTSIATTAFVQSLLAQQPAAGMQPSNSTPLMNGTAAAGTGVEGSRYDHVHPSDTSKLNLSGGTMGGDLYFAQSRSNFTWLAASGNNAPGTIALRPDKATVAGGTGVFATDGVESYGYVGCGSAPWNTGLKVNTAGTAYNAVPSGTYANWRTSRVPLLQVDGSALGDVGYMGVRWAVGGNAFASIDANPAAAIGNTSVIAFHVGTSTAHRFTINGAGDTVAAGNVTAYSDIRLKTDIEVIPDALAKVMQLTGHTYTRIDSGERQTGLIAQDVQAVLPEAVKVGDDGMLSLAYGNLVGLLVEAIKELKAEIEELKK